MLFSNSEMEPLIQLRHMLGRVVSIMRREKYMYDHMITKMVSDILARCLANRETGVVAIHVDIRGRALRRVFFCSQNNNVTQEQVLNLSRYGFNQQPHRFMSDILKRRIALHLNRGGPNDLVRFLMDPRHNDIDFLFQMTQNLFNCIETAAFETDCISSLHFLIITYLDFVMLPILFGDIFGPEPNRQHQNFEAQHCVRVGDTCEHFQAQLTARPDDLEHPEAKLACHLRIQPDIVNNYVPYIGVSFLSCVLCSELLDAFNCEYRGRSGDYENRWQIPRNADAESLRILLEHFAIIINGPAHLFRGVDQNAERQGNISDDLSHFNDFFVNRPLHFTIRDTPLPFLEDDFELFFIRLLSFRNTLLEAI